MGDFCLHIAPKFGQSRFLQLTTMCSNPLLRFAITMQCLRIWHGPICEVAKPMWKFHDKKMERLGCIASYWFSLLQLHHHHRSYQKKNRDASTRSNPPSKTPNQSPRRSEMLARLSSQSGPQKTVPLPKSPHQMHCKWSKPPSWQE